MMPSVWNWMKINIAEHLSGKRGNLNENKFKDFQWMNRMNNDNLQFTGCPEPSMKLNQYVNVNVNVNV